MYLKYNRPHCTFFGYIPGFGPPGALKSAIWRRFSIDFCRIRAPMRGHRKMACFPHFSPHDRSKKGNAIGKTKHALHSRKAITFGMFDGSLVHRKWQGALRSHFHATMALQMPLFGAPRGPNSRSKSKPRHLIGKKIILILLAKPMHRENASRRYKRV